MRDWGTRPEWYDFFAERFEMKTLFAVVALAGSIVAASTVVAQDQPQAEHEFLKRFVGQWEMVSEGAGMKGEATMESSMLGGLWLVNRSEHTISGMKLKSLQTIGYDPDTGKYVGTYVDSMMNHLWHYEGSVDESGNKIVLNAKGPSMSGEGTAMYRDAYEFTDDDTIVATASMQGANGEWIVFMQGTATRKK